jgi:hypothetical protein
MPDREIQARFIEPMLLLRTENLPQGALWQYELKLDGFRAQAIKSGGRVRFRSRNDKDFNARYPAIVQALAAMPDETVIDGEIVALESGRPSFNALQNHRSSAASLVYYAFDVMILAGIVEIRLRDPAGIGCDFTHQSQRSAENRRAFELRADPIGHHNLANVGDRPDVGYGEIPLAVDPDFNRRGDVAQEAPMGRDADGASPGVLEFSIARFFGAPLDNPSQMCPSCGACAMNWTSRARSLDAAWDCAAPAPCT